MTMDCEQDAANPITIVESDDHALRSYISGSEVVLTEPEGQNVDSAAFNGNGKNIDQGIREIVTAAVDEVNLCDITKQLGLGSRAITIHSEGAVHAIIIIEDVPYMCTVCGGCYYFAKDLREHAEQVHGYQESRTKIGEGGEIGKLSDTDDCEEGKDERTSTTMNEEIHSDSAKNVTDKHLLKKATPEGKKRHERKQKSSKVIQMPSSRVVSRSDVPGRLCELKLEGDQNGKDCSGVDENKLESGTKVLDGGRNRCGLHRAAKDRFKQTMADIVQSQERITKRQKRGGVEDAQQPVPKADFTCSRCGDIFEERKALRKHFQSHKGRTIRTGVPQLPEPGKHKCTVCGRAFALERTLDKHVLITHPDLRVALNDDKRKACCEVCGKILAPTSLAGHLLLHESQKRYSCPTCKREFRHSQSMAVHMRSHTGQRPYKCTYCNKTFAYRAVFVVHTLTHTGEKPFTCDICKKGFFTKVRLQNHSTVHTDERPYQCNHCNKAFKTKSTFVQHERLMHSKERPHRCEICDKYFVSQSQLRMHRLTHTGKNERPFKCTECKAAFLQNAGLRRHVISVHNKSLKCKLCTLQFKSFKQLKNHAAEGHGAAVDDTWTLEVDGAKNLNNVSNLKDLVVEVQTGIT